MRLLVVEDEELLARSLARGLRAEGFEVDVERDGATGLWRAQTSTYDVIVLDLLLPTMNGFRVCETLRRDGSPVPVLVLTAKDGEFDETEALDTGADDYLRKPFSFPVLVARINALARRDRRQFGAVMTCGDLALDPVRHRCWRGATAIPLTPRETDVLAHLMRHPEQLVAKSELLDAVWGFEATDPNLAEVYVGYLRRKIDAPFARRSVETVRGRGYRLRDDR
jgi:two-component system, OmpR family, response regulator